MKARALLAVLAGAAALAAAPIASPAQTPAVTPYWETRAERSGYRLTADYEETMRYCRMLEAGSNWIRVTSFGTSGQGRELPLVILSKDRAFTPEAARATGKPIVLVQNGIHSGEIEGKDACLALMRDIAVLRNRAALLDNVILLVLPIFSVDAHERRSPYNRINQNGPEEMGWRTTPIGLNLNRDYLKAESPEMRAMISQVFTRWWPHLLIDDHTTDGADYRHDITYGFNFGPATPAAVGRWMTDAFEGRILPRLAAMGHLPAPYIWFRGPWPANGISMNSAPPRFSTGYAAIQCRPALLVETHMLKPYGTRVRAIYDLLAALLEEVNAHPRDLTGAVAAAEAEVIARGNQPDPAKREVALTSKTTERSVPFAFKGVVSRLEMSEITGGLVPHFTDTPSDSVIPLYRDLVPALTVRQPVGYLVPQEWTVVRDRLELHGVRFRRFASAWSDTAEVAHVQEWNASPRLFEGHHPTIITRLALDRRLRSYRPGDLWVPLNQRGGLVAVHLLEGLAPDGLAYWNAFDTVLEFKEYAEDYVMEPIALRMLGTDPALRREFQERLASDSTFARNPQARIDFFYRRSPWADPEQNLLPPARALAAPPEAVLEPEGR